MTHVASPRQAAADVLVGSPRNAAQRRRALELLCARTPAPQRDVELLQLEAGPLDGLFVAVQGDHVLGAALARRQPGRTALVWPPRLTAVPGEQTGTALLRAAVDFAVVGVPVALAGLAYLVLLGWRLAPKRQGSRDPMPCSWNSGENAPSCSQRVYSSGEGVPV